ncbi:hypothetical protein, partial [Bradyrhizobium sp. S69]|uniref:hypothetical protein n=1 Tax=Bradyrhizobium sp. S69 TaxID=1641856 RepID=UPI001AED900F
AREIVIALLLGLPLGPAALASLKQDGLWRRDTLKHVFGYLVLSPQMTGEPYWIVMAHSLVEPPEGGLLEVTPEAATDGVPFIRHDGDAALHEEFRKSVKIFVLPSAISEA